ncbi:MAG: hypothetical protein Tsb0021_16190 [Chlamydiales bacterium]
MCTNVLKHSSFELGKTRLGADKPYKKDGWMKLGFPECNESSCMPIFRIKFLSKIPSPFSLLFV